MSKKFIYITMVMSISFFSCKKENSILPEDFQTDTITEIHYSNDPDYILSNKNAQELLVHLENEQTQLKRKLKKANKKEAEALFIEYYKRLTVIVDSLNTAEINTLKSYHTLKDNNHDTILRKETTYNKAGLYFRKLDSAHYDFKIKPGYFYNLFRNKVSNEYKEYLKLRYQEHKYLYDAQVSNKEVSLENQRELLINWEKFIAKNKDFKFIDYAKKSYTDNLMNYLFGTVTKPSFDVSAKKLYVENEQEYITFVKKNPKLISAEITKAFLKHFYINDKNFKAEEFYVELKDFTKKEISERVK